MLSTMGTYPKNIIRTSDITVLYSLFDQEEAGLFKDFLKPKMTLQSILYQPHNVSGDNMG